MAREQTIIAAFARCELATSRYFASPADAGEDTDAKLVEERLHLPQLARHIVFADDIDVVGRGVFGFLGSDDVVEQRLARELVADRLRADKARHIHRNAGCSELLRRLLADRFDVVAGHGRNAGLIHEDRRRIVFLDDFLDGPPQALLAAEDHILLAHVGGEAHAVELRAGGAAVAVVPGMAFAGDGAVHEVRDIGDGLERDFRAVERAAARRAARLQWLGAAFLAFLLGLALIDAATRFVEDILDFVRQRGHHVSWTIFEASWPDPLVSWPGSDPAIQR